jgi:hypothetical protein
LEKYKDIDLRRIDMMPKEYYIECLRVLLKALDIQDIEIFLERLTLENCRKLGSAYHDSVKRICAERDILKNSLGNKCE